MRKWNFSRQIKQAERGQSLVEMTVGFLLLLIMLSGLVDLGRAYFVFVALEDGAGEAALFLSINPFCRSEADTNVDLGRDCSNPNNAEYRARNSGGGNVNWQDANIEIYRTNKYGAGDPVSVTIDYTLPLISPFMPRFAGVNPLTLSVTASQVIISE